MVYIFNIFKKINKLFRNYCGIVSTLERLDEYELPRSKPRINIDE
jgi:hypothetical protein